MSSLRAAFDTAFGQLTREGRHSGAEAAGMPNAVHWRLLMAITTGTDPTPGQPTVNRVEGT
jgi:hypothetical protein